MDQATARDRLELSRTVITRWLAMGVPGGRLEDKARMVFEESQIVLQIARDHPALADEAREIGQLYGELGLRLTHGAH